MVETEPQPLPEGEFEVRPGSLAYSWRISRKDLPPRETWPDAEHVTDCYWFIDSQGRRSLRWEFET